MSKKGLPSTKKAAKKPPKRDKLDAQADELLRETLKLALEKTKEGELINASMLKELLAYRVARETPPIDTTPAGPPQSPAEAFNNLLRRG